MKCEIAKDLLALYVDDLCSPETRKELEAHLKDCPECAQRLENYRKELKRDLAEEDKKGEIVTENKAEAEPMKKVGKKLKKSRIGVIVLSLALLLILGGIGVLSFGEATNCGPSFTMISDMIKIKSACKDLSRGDTQAFAKLMAMRLEDEYVLRATDAFADMDAYEAEIEKNMKDAYEYYFKGKDIKVKFGEIGMIPYAERGTADEAESYILVNFYEGDTLLRTMEFTKVSNGYFVVYEGVNQSTDNPLAPSFTDGLITYDDILYKIAMPYAAQSTYNKLKSGENGKMGGGLALIVEKPGEDENDEFSAKIRERMEFLRDNGCYIKNVTYNLSEYDNTIGKWIYKVWITYEDQSTNAVFVTEQKFISHNNRLYVKEGENAYLSSITADEKGINKEVVQTAIQMFE